MYLLSKALTYSTAFFTLVGFQIILIRPVLIILIGPLVALAVLFTIWRITGRRIFSQNFVNFSLIVLLLLASSFILFLFIEHILIQELLAFGAVMLELLIFRNIFSFYYKHESYQPYSLENITTYTNLVTIFFATASLYNTLIFFNIRSIALTPIVLLVAFLSPALTFWVSKISWQQAKIPIIAIALLTSELFFVVSFLPTSSLVNALIPTLVHYVMVMISRDFLRKNLLIENVRKYVALSLIILIVVLVTTRWT